MIRRPFRTHTGLQLVPRTDARRGGTIRQRMPGRKLSTVEAWVRELDHQGLRRRSAR